MQNEPVPPQPPKGKTKYKAIYRDPKASPFALQLFAPVKFVEFDSGIPIEQVEEWAQSPEARENFEFVSLEVVTDHHCL